MSLIVSTSRLSYWTTTRSGIVARSSGAMSMSGAAVTSMPPLWIERWRGKPSMRAQNSSQRSQSRQADGRPPRACRRRARARSRATELGLPRSRARQAGRGPAGRAAALRRRAASSSAQPMRSAVPGRAARARPRAPGRRSPARRSQSAAAPAGRVRGASRVPRPVRSQRTLAGESPGPALVVRSGRPRRIAGPRREARRSLGPGRVTAGRRSAAAAGALSGDARSERRRGAIRLDRLRRRVAMAATGPDERQPGSSIWRASPSPRRSAPSAIRPPRAWFSWPIRR